VHTPVAGPQLVVATPPSVVIAPLWEYKLLAIQPLTLKLKPGEPVLYQTQGDVYSEAFNKLALDGWELDRTLNFQEIGALGDYAVFKRRKRAQQ
jgi:hypothetical protein